MNLDWKALGLASIVSLAAGSFASNARAQQPTEQEKLAQHDVDAGVKHFSAGEYHEAYVRLKSAAAVYPSPHIRANMVRAGSKSTYPQERVESARTARALLREGKLRDGDSQRVRAALEQLNSVLGRIEVHGVKDETVRADGVLLESSVLTDPLDVLPGKHEIVVGTEHHTVSVEAGETRTVTLGVVEPQDPDPRATKPVANAVEPPKQEVRVARDGRPIALGIIGGLAAASLGTALVTALVATGTQTDMRDETRTGAERADSRSAYDSLRTVSTVTTWTGVGLVAAGGVTGLLWPKKTIMRPASSWRIAPVVGMASIGVVGHF